MIKQDYWGIFRSAGCGRTGTICALDYTQTLLKQGVSFKDLLNFIE